jgi:hypothetical protein
LTQSKKNLPVFYTWFTCVAKKYRDVFKILLSNLACNEIWLKSSCESSPLQLHHKEKKKNKNPLLATS